MADEYLHVVKNVLQRNTPGEMAEHLARVLGIGTGSPNINLVTDTGRLRQNQLARRAHFALAFGEDLKADQGAHLEESGPSRKTAVREAFNSPFWPFVLSTTSVGQEGLDFHLFCRDVVHWNLPSNPVDLEQREGRINRRDGLAIRRAIAREWPIKRLAGALTSKPLSFWENVFNAIDNDDDVQRYKHGLYPHWVFEPRGGQVERIRRHLFFYADSQDAIRYEELKERLALYRLVFGQPRQQDLLDRIQRTVRDESGRQVSHAALTRYMINLSPLGKAHAVARAALEADDIAGSADKLRQLLVDVERIEHERGVELDPVARDSVNSKPSSDGDLTMARGHRATEEAVRALIYLRDPYDAVMDQHVDLGLEDDHEVLRLAARECRGLTLWTAKLCCILPSTGNFFKRCYRSPNASCGTKSSHCPRSLVAQGRGEDCLLDGPEETTPGVQSWWPVAIQACRHRPVDRAAEGGLATEGGANKAMSTLKAIASGFATASTRAGSARSRTRRSLSCC